MASKKPVKSVDKASQQMIEHAAACGYELAWDRYEAMQPQCDFGTLGICCKNCMLGPCRIDPFGEGAKCGVCGATADVIAARNLARHAATGAAAHSDHGRDVVHTLLLAARGKAADYEIKNEKKLRAAGRGVRHQDGRQGRGEDRRRGRRGGPGRLRPPGRQAAAGQPRAGRPPEALGRAGRHPRRRRQGHRPHPALHPHGRRQRPHPHPEGHHQGVPGGRLGRQHVCHRRERRAVRRAGAHPQPREPGRAAAGRPSTSSCTATSRRSRRCWWRPRSRPRSARRPKTPAPTASSSPASAARPTRS